MPNEVICAKCRKRTVIATVTCNICKASYHPSCATLYIRSKTDVVCCVRTLGHLLESVPTPCANTPLTAPHLAPTILTPVPALDVPRSVPSPRADTPLTALHPAPTIHTPVPTPALLHSLCVQCTDTPHTAPNRAPTNDTVVPTQRLSFASMSFPSSAPTLPPDWASFNPQQQLTHIMEACTANGAMLTSLSNSIQQNTTGIAHNSSEIRAIKEIHAHVPPSADILITGIPACVTTPHNEIVQRLISRLNLANTILQTDILDILTVNRKPNSTPSTSQPPTARPLYETISLLVKFKSVIVRNYVIQAKRRIGNISVADIFNDMVPEPPHGTLHVNEFMPSLTYSLYQQTRIKAREANYQRVWVRDGVINVRKAQNSPIIPIVTEMDLYNLR